MPSQTLHSQEQREMHSGPSWTAWRTESPTHHLFIFMDANAGAGIRVGEEEYKKWGHTTGTPDPTTVLVLLYCNLQATTGLPWSTRSFPPPREAHRVRPAVLRIVPRTKNASTTSSHGEISTVLFTMSPSTSNPPSRRALTTVSCAPQYGSIVASHTADLDESRLGVHRSTGVRQYQTPTEVSNSPTFIISTLKQSIPGDTDGSLAAKIVGVLLSAAENVLSHPSRKHVYWGGSRALPSKWSSNRSGMKGKGRDRLCG